MELNDILRPIFWDVNFADLRWEAHRDFILKRILARGTYPMLQWLRATLGDAELRAWLIEKQGAQIPLRNALYWGLILDIPEAVVLNWQTHQPDLWETRCLPTS